MVGNIYTTLRSKTDDKAQRFEVHDNISVRSFQNYLSLEYY